MSSYEEFEAVVSRANEVAEMEREDADNAQAWARKEEELHQLEQHIRDLNWLRKQLDKMGVRYGS